MNNYVFNVHKCLQHLRHFLPAQSPLKDFVHHNTLHAFQSKPFFEALQLANETFGYKTMLSLTEYRELHKNGTISDVAIDTVLRDNKSSQPSVQQKKHMFDDKVDQVYERKIGRLRRTWKESLKIDLDTIVHLNLFRLVGSYLDQGISPQPFPSNANGLLAAIEELEQHTLFEFFHSQRVKDLLFKKNKEIESLLDILVGDERYFEQYLFDQQFSHPGWSGIVSVLENDPTTLFSQKEIVFADLVYLELLLEIDALDKIYGVDKWLPISKLTNLTPTAIFEEITCNKNFKTRILWQEALELSYYDQVLYGLVNAPKAEEKTARFQAFFCIDDREESIRRHLEIVLPECETFGTPAHYNLPIFYNPAGGKFNTQVCPGGIKPEHIIIDDRNSEKNKKDLYFDQRSHGFFGGWLISQTLGFWSAVKLFLNIFKPSISPAHSSSFEHMSHRSNLIIENIDGKKKDGLKVGFTIEEMCQIVESELKRTGLTNHFSALIYIIGHGGSSTNNPYYAGYNCGACSGRPSSLNARVFAAMANRNEVRTYLKSNGINIPSRSHFVGGLHDTTRDEIVFYDTETLSEENSEAHTENVPFFNKALTNNSKERARQLLSIKIKKSAEAIHEDIKKRSVSLFEPRPELNHSNNCLCIVGSRNTSRNLFLDQRAFLNSYDWKSDVNGDYLMCILGAAIPVCGGINLEYYFSRVDNENFGAGSKLPHNVVGLFGVTNGIEGDLRTGLPIQMVEVHAPLRLLMIVEQKPELVLEVIKRNAKVYEWVKNGWINLAVIDPENKKVYRFKEGELTSYQMQQKEIEVAPELEALFESSSTNLPVYQLN
jgi:uncharacterized protein YbcC (UPF0753/DUF2309 family)